MPTAIGCRTVTVGSRSKGGTKRCVRAAGAPSGRPGASDSGSGGESPALSGGSSGTGGSSSSGGGGAGSGSGTASGFSRTAPWSLSFTLRERETLWTEENQARLVRIVASHQLDIAIEEVELRLDELQVLLPRLASRCSAIKPSTLAALLRDPGGALVPRLITLRQLLPGADIASLAAAEPELLLLREASDLRRGLERLQQLLGPAADVGAIVQREPRMLDEELVGEVLEELQRLMPCADAVQTLLSDPSWLLRVERGTRRLGEHPE